MSEAVAGAGGARRAPLSDAVPRAGGINGAVPTSASSFGRLIDTGDDGTGLRARRKASESQARAEPNAMPVVAPVVESVVEPTVEPAVQATAQRNAQPAAGQMVAAMLVGVALGDVLPPSMQGVEMSLRADPAQAAMPTVGALVPPGATPNVPNGSLAGAPGMNAVGSPSLASDAAPGRQEGQRGLSRPDPRPPSMTGGLASVQLRATHGRLAGTPSGSGAEPLASADSDAAMAGAVVARHAAGGAPAAAASAASIAPLPEASGELRTHQAVPVVVTQADGASERATRTLAMHIAYQAAHRVEQATVRLDPPLLGAVEVSVRRSGGGLAVDVRTTSEAVAAALQPLSEMIREEIGQRHGAQIAVSIRAALAAASPVLVQAAHATGAVAGGAARDSDTPGGNGSDGDPQARDERNPNPGEQHRHGAKRDHPDHNEDGVRRSAAALHPGASFAMASGAANEPRTLATDTRS